MQTSKHKKPKIIKTTVLLNIPYDCIANLTEYLTYKELLLTFELVCKVFHDISTIYLTNHVWNCKLKQYLISKKEFIEYLNNTNKSTKLDPNKIKIEVFDITPPRKRFEILKTACKDCIKFYAKYWLHINWLDIELTDRLLVKIFNKVISAECLKKIGVNSDGFNIPTAIQKLDRHVSLCILGLDVLACNDDCLDYVGQVSWGQADGIGKAYDDGVLRFSGNFSCNFPHGKCLEYYPNGNIKFDGIWMKGKQVLGNLYKLDGIRETLKIYPEFEIRPDLIESIIEFLEKDLDDPDYYFGMRYIIGANVKFGDIKKIKCEV